MKSDANPEAAAICAAALSKFSGATMLLALALPDEEGLLPMYSPPMNAMWRWILNLSQQPERCLGLLV